MAIPREQLRRVVDAGHPDTAPVGVPVSLLREMLNILPVAEVDAALVPLPVGVLREMLAILPTEARA